MLMQVISPDNAARFATDLLGLAGQGIALSSTEGLAVSLRRAASVLCPATPRQLVQAVLDAVVPLSPVDSVSRDTLTDLVDALVACGDLIELSEESDEKARRLLYLGPPTYVEKSPGKFLLSGVKPFGEPLVDDELIPLIEYDQHRRTIELDPDGAQAVLASCRLREVSRGAWAQIPDKAITAESFAREFANRLASMDRSGQIAGLTIIDPRRPTRYYKGRWREPRIGDTGNYVARRPQSFGADRWCYVQLNNGQPCRLLDLPIDPVAFARDEAWRLLAACDAASSQPQTYRTYDADACDFLLTDLFSPLPSWAQKYLELVGTPVTRSRGALMTYQMSRAAAKDAQTLLQDALWMAPLPREDDDE